MGAIAERLAEYGDVGILAIIVAVISYLIWKMDKRVDTNKSELKQVRNDMEDIEGTCVARKEHFSETFDRLEALERKDAGDDGRFDKIDTQLITIGDNVTKIVDHFVSKGMKA